MSWRNRSPKTLAHRWPLNGHYADLIRAQDGTPVNSPTWAQTPWGPQCIELDGDDAHVNVGDVTALNAVSAFTVTFWMNQDLPDQDDMIFVKEADGTHGIVIRGDRLNGGFFRCYIRNGANSVGYFSMPAVISANAWHHIACVYDGGGVGKADQLKIYLNGAPQVLSFSAPSIPTAIADLSGVDATIGAAVQAFDGKLSDFRLFYAALSHDEVNDVMRGHG